MRLLKGKSEVVAPISAPYNLLALPKIQGKYTNHIANRGHTRARQALSTRSMVFNDCASSALHSEDTGNLQNDI